MVILGDGLLGTELIKQLGCSYVSRKKDGIDFDDINTYKHLLESHRIIINCIANTDTYSTDKEAILKTNYEAVVNLVDYCVANNKMLVHISTDYVYSGSESNASEDSVPVHCPTWYAYSKLLADAYIELKLSYSLIIRCSHKPNPFPYPKAITTQVGNFDYVDVIAEKIVNLIKYGELGIVNVGTEKKTMFDLAVRTAKVEAINTKIHPLMPTDISMDLSLLDSIERIIDED
jgi:dTDP-4-dehydrorhamnose reductase